MVSIRLTQKLEELPDALSHHLDPKFPKGNQASPRTRSFLHHAASVVRSQQKLYWIKRTEYADSMKTAEAENSL
jgi:hypothetical protein